MLMLASRSVDPLAQHVVSLKEKVVTNEECGHHSTLVGISYDPAQFEKLVRKLTRMCAKDYPLRKERCFGS